MYARIGTFDVPPEQLDQVISLFQDTVVPAFSKHKGFLRYTAYVSRDRGRIVGVSCWETLTDLEESGGTGAWAREEAAQRGAQMVGEPQVLELAFDSPANVVIEHTIIEQL